MCYFLCGNTAGSLSNSNLDLQAMFPDGRIEEFIEAQSVSAELMATPEVAVSIAAAMAHFHFSMLKHFTMLDHLPSCMSPVAQIWDRLREWARIAIGMYTPEELKQYGLSKVMEEVSDIGPAQTHACTFKMHTPCSCSHSSSFSHLSGFVSHDPSENVLVP